MMFREIAIFIICMALLFGSIILVVNWISSESCEAKSVSFEGYDYGLIQGCMVKHKGRWLPLENIRGFDDRD